MAPVPGDLGPLAALLQASHLAVPEELPGLVHTHAAGFGARAASVYLADLDQRWLTPLPREDGKPNEEISVDTTLAGRCYRTLEILDFVDESGDRFVWVPMLDGTERLGVVELVFDGGVTVGNGEMMAYVRLVAELILTKGGYGDFFEVHRRRKPVSVAAELLWQLLPPLTFGSQDLVISAVFLPTEDLGGDAFDYSVDPSCAQVAIFDAMGHDLQAGLMATAAVAAYRNARRSKLDLFSTAEHIHRNIVDHFGANRFVTGLLTSLEKSTDVSAAM